MYVRQIHYDKRQRTTDTMQSQKTETTNTMQSQKTETKPDKIAVIDELKK